MLSLKTEPKSSSLKQLFSECFQLSDTFSLTSGPYTTPSGEALLYLLKTYWLHTFKTRHWFCYYVPEGYEKRVFLFRSCAESKRIMMDSYRHLFFGNDFEWDLPEDICFFSGGKLFMGTVSHEGICYVYPPSQETAHRFQEICRWETRNEDTREQIVYHIQE